MKKIRYLLLAILIVSITIVSSMLIDKKSVNAEESATPVVSESDGGETEVTQCTNFTITADSVSVGKVPSGKYENDGTYYHYSDLTTSSIYYGSTYSSKNHTFSTYTATSSDEGCSGKIYTAYCIDAGLSGPDKDGGNGLTDYVLASNLDVNAADNWGYTSKGLLYIYSQRGSYDIIEQSMAMRLVATYWKVANHNDKWEPGYVATVNQGANWTADKGWGKDNGAFIPKPDRVSSNSNIEPFMNNVRTLYQKAIKEYDTLLDETTSLKLEIGNIALSNPEFNSSGFTIQGSVVISGLDTMSEGANISFNKIECPSGVTCTSSVSTSDNLLDTANSDGTYSIPFTISGGTSLNSATLDVGVSFKYFDPLDSNNILLVKADTPNVGYQRFVLFEEGTKEKELSKDDMSVAICDNLVASGAHTAAPWDEYYSKYCNPTCFSSPNLNPSSPPEVFDENLFKSKCCDSLNSLLAAGTIDQGQYDLGKPYCVTADDCVTYDLPATCDLSATSEKGWVLTSMYEGIPLGENEVDFKMCVLSDDYTDSNADRTDATTRNSLRIVENNLYCEVACIESWDFKLPNKNFSKANNTAIKAGQYFALAAQIVGSRTCVSSEKINYEQFEKDVTEANKEAVKQYNIYLENDAKAKAYENILEDGTHGGNITIPLTGSQEYNIEKIVTKTTRTETPATDSDGDGNLECSSGTLVGTKCVDEVTSSPSKTNIGKVKCVTNFTVSWKTNQSKHIDGSDYDSSKIESAAGINDSKSYNPSYTIDSSSSTSVSGDTTTETEIRTPECDIYYGSSSTEAMTNVISYLGSERSGFESAASSALSAFGDEMEKIEDVYIPNIKACSEWTKDVDASFYNPEIEFNYAESYYMQKIIDANKNTFVYDRDETLDKANNTTKSSLGNKLAGGKANVGTFTQYCDAESDGSLGKNFECSAGATPGTVTKELFYVKCDKYDCTKESKEPKLPTNISVIKEVTVGTTLKPAPQFYAVHTTGEAILAEEVGSRKDVSLINYKDDYMGQILPINLNTGQGTYQYRLTLRNVGMYSDGNYGRLIGGASGKYNVYTELSTKDEYDFICTYEVFEDPCICCGKESIKEQISVDSSGVNTTIVPDPDNPGKNKLETQNTSLIDTSGKVNFSYRPISLSTIADDRSWVAGTNWDTDKGEAILDSIALHGETIYKEPEYSFLITPTGVATLKAIGVSSGDSDMNCMSVGAAGSLGVSVTVNGVADAPDVICLSDLITDIYNDNQDGVQALVKRPGFTYVSEKAVVIDINDAIINLESTDVATKDVWYAGAWK